MREFLLRGAVLAYVLTLWLAVWPFWDVPVLGAVQRAAEGLLMAASLRPGMAVFPGHEVDGASPWAACTQVYGRIDRNWEGIYTPECPRQGLLLLESPFEDTVSRMLVVRKLPLLRSPLADGPGAPEAVRNLLQLSDYFCHARPGLDRIALRWVQQLRNFDSGDFPDPENELVCVSDCDDSGASPPRCSLRPFASGQWKP